MTVQGLYMSVSFTGLGAHTLHEFYAKNDPDLIAKFLLCCRDRRSKLNAYLELGCRTWPQPIQLI